jgi:hypothetical protein
MTVPRGLIGALLVVACLAALATTPISAGFARREAAACDVLSSWDLWLTGLGNIRHLISYSVLTAIAVWAFGMPRALPAAGLVLLVSAAVELEQMLFADGHCRLRDMLPNIVAIGLGLALALLVARLLRRPAAGARSR